MTKDEILNTLSSKKSFIEKEFERSLKVKLNEMITDCYNNYVDEFKRQGYDVKAGNIDLEIALQSDKIKLDVSAPLSITDGSSSSSGFQDLSFEIPTKIYDILMLANNIVKYETTYGEYELVQSQLLYPEMPVNAFKVDDGTVIYVINNKDVKYYFAVRSYVQPAGYGL